jgi:hypothetical protein
VQCVEYNNGGQSRADDSYHLKFGLSNTTLTPKY